LKTLPICLAIDRYLLHKIGLTGTGYRNYPGGPDRRSGAGRHKLTSAAVNTLAANQHVQ